jgi:hypothetical protein
VEIMKQFRDGMTDRINLGGFAAGDDYAAVPGLLAALSFENDGSLGPATA